MKPRLTFFPSLLLMAAGAVAADPIQPRAEIYVKDLMVTFDPPEKAFVAP